MRAVFLILLGISLASDAEPLMGLAKEKINQVIQKNRTKIRDCYDAVLKEDSSLKGKVVLRFNIQPNGKVTNPGIAEDGMHSEEFNQCVLRAFASWKFPTGKNITEVTKYPLYLSPAR